MWYVYILRSLKDRKFYVGYTSDLKIRVIKHNLGTNSATRYRRPLELVYNEVCATKREAILRERKIKSWKGGDEFKKLKKLFKT